MKSSVYFFPGGMIVSLSTYLGAQGKWSLPIFVSTFPAITGSTFVLMYLNRGNDAIIGYAKHLLWFVPPWIVYVTAMIMGSPQLGSRLSMVGALVLYYALRGCRETVTVLGRHSA